MPCPGTLALLLSFFSFMTFATLPRLLQRFALHGGTLYARFVAQRMRLVGNNFPDDNYDRDAAPTACPDLPRCCKQHPRQHTRWAVIAALLTNYNMTFGLPFTPPPHPTPLPCQPCPAPPHPHPPHRTLTPTRPPPHPPPHPPLGRRLPTAWPVTLPSRFCCAFAKPPLPTTTTVGSCRH